MPHRHFVTLPPAQSIVFPWLCAVCCCCCGGGGSSPVSLQASVSISQLTISPFPVFLPSDLFYDSHSCLLASSRFLRLLPGAVTFLSQRIQRILFCVGCISSASLHSPFHSILPLWAFFFFFSCNDWYFSQLSMIIPPPPYPSVHRPVSSRPSTSRCSPLLTFFTYATFTILS